MQAVHDLLMSMTAILFAIAGIVLVQDLCEEFEYRKGVARGFAVEEPSPSRWKVSVALALAAWIPLLLALALAIFSTGRVGVRTGKMHNVHASQQHRSSAAKPETLRPPKRHA